jgi:hypothetical protein
MKNSESLPSVPQQTRDATESLQKKLTENVGKNKIFATSCFIKTTDHQHHMISHLFLLWNFRVF